MPRLRTLDPGIRVTVRVPATSANLGPGFDSMGLALSLFDDVEARTVEYGFRAEVSGEGAATLPTDGRHLVISQVRTHLARHGWDAPGLVLTARNRIPHSRGLGSSAAAYVTAILIANALLPESEQATAEELLQHTARLEGHPDNVAPALTGGLAVSWADAEEKYRSVRITPHASITPVVAIPEHPLSTETARGLLPTQVDHAVAAANSGRAALLTHALSQDPDTLLPATRDLLHQDYREPAMPESLALMNSLRADGVAAVVSGAGPTVMALARTEAEATTVRESIQSRLREATQRWTVEILPVATEGARVEVFR
ncbi:MAG: homoserine kinase [Micrococcaceae bacterium]